MSDKPSLLVILHKALSAWVKQPNSSFMVYVMYYNAYKRGNFFEQPPGVTKYGVDIYGEHCKNVVRYIGGVLSMVRSCTHLINVLCVFFVRHGRNFFCGYTQVIQT